MFSKNLRPIFITGANKGIGFALVKRLLEEREDVFVFLGSRDVLRGQEAVSKLCALNPSYEGRLQCVSCDVASDASVNSAAKEIEAQLKQVKSPLFGLVNNAGIGSSPKGHKEVFNVNLYGPKRVFETIYPLLEPKEGRVLLVSSAAGPNFVAKQEDTTQAMLTNRDVEFEEIEGFIHTFLNASDDNETHSGLASSYGASKAALNAYLLFLYKRFPNFFVNALTPGFIETDLTMPMAEARGLSAKEMGMKTPFEATDVYFKLLFETQEKGWYFGSDALRSPLHCYREPGTAAWDGVF